MGLGAETTMRWLRSLLLASLTACSAGAAHLDAGGHVAPTWLLVALALMGTPVAFSLSGRQWRFGPLAAFIATTQLVLHAAMTMSMPAGHEHAEVVVSSGAASSLTPMLLTHIVVTVALAAALAGAERALWWVVRRFVHATRPVPVCRHRDGVLVLPRQIRTHGHIHRPPGRAPPSTGIFLLP